LGKWLMKTIFALLIVVLSACTAEPVPVAVTRAVATAVDEWRPIGLGLGNPIPKPVRWSNDGRDLFFSNVPSPDGCGTTVNGGDLWRLSLSSGQLTEMTPFIGLVIDVSPDGTQLAVDAAYGRGFLIRHLETGSEQSIPLPDPGSNLEKFQNPRLSASH
jgi:hypothetical protein